MTTPYTSSATNKKPPLSKREKIGVALLALIGLIALIVAQFIGGQSTWYTSGYSYAGMPSTISAFNQAVTNDGFTVSQGASSFCISAVALNHEDGAAMLPVDAGIPSFNPGPSNADQVQWENGCTAGLKASDG